uniref:BTB domain-containing protein n=1 Tax=Setaria italica TaxID=4555 RepID=K3ZNF3_SETIT
MVHIEADVKARFKLSLLDQAGEPLLPYSHEFKVMRTFRSTQSSGSCDFLKRKELEMSPNLRDDSFRIRCDVTVSKGSTRTTTVQLPALPPSDLHQHLGNLLSSQVGADVVFDVGGETFTAHRYVLAARSPVFMAELYGTTKETTADRVRISDVEPEVFRAFLHFIYTDLLPEVDEAVIAQHLLAQIDLRARILCIHIDTNTAATTLALAEQHRCLLLKEACFKFMASPCNFKGVMASDGFEHMMRSCPSLLKELAANIAA